MTGPTTLDPDAFVAGRLRLILSGSTLFLVALSWPLWIDLADFPAIPFLRVLPNYPVGWSWVGLAVLAGCLALGLTDRWGRIGLGSGALVFALLIFGDQLRLQPWVYQFVAMAAALSILPPRPALALCRIFVASIFAHSGLSKLDASFVAEMGPLLVRTLSRILGVDSSSVTGEGRPPWVLAMPAGELLVAALLLIRPTRRLGFLAAAGMHAVLILILGPWGLGHSPIVLGWNLAMAVEEFLLFWPEPTPVRGPRVRSIRGTALGVGFASLVVMPLGERWGLLDSWPSHALYASHCERSRIAIRGPGFDRLPSPVRVASRRSPDGDGWILNPTDWTRSVRGVPVYPQARYANGLAEWIAARVGGPPEGEVRVVHESRADGWTGRRVTTELTGIGAIRAAGGRFWFNAHPSRVVGR